jgi:hypothetical protein
MGQSREAELHLYDVAGPAGPLERWARLIPDYKGWRIMFTGLKAQQSSIDVIGAVFVWDGDETFLQEKITIGFMDLEHLYLEGAIRYCQDKITEAVGRLKQKIDEAKEITK